MAVTLNRFIVTAATTLPAETTTVTAGEVGGGGAGTSGTPASSWGTTQLYFPKGSQVVLDNGTPSPLYTILNGLGVLRAAVAGTDDVGREAISN
jgi:hypothetical protein